MTRREKLHFIVTIMLAQNQSLKDLAASLESFKSSGKSGLDTWLEETYNQLKGQV